MAWKTLLDKAAGKKNWETLLDQAATDTQADLGGIVSQPVSPEDLIEPEPIRQPVRAELPGPQLPGGTPADLGQSEPIHAYQRQLEQRRQEIQNAEALENYYNAFPDKRPRKYKNFIDELLRNTGGGVLNVASGLTGTLASVSEGAIWDPEQLEGWAQKLHQKSKKPAYAPAEGGGWKGFVAASVGQAAPYMAAAVGATMMTGTPLAAFGVGYSVEGDNAYRTAIELGAPEDEAQLRRFLVGTINGAIEQMQVSRVMSFAKTGRGSAKGILKTASDRALKKALKQAGKLTYEAAKHSAAEALEEVLQETTQIASEAKYNPKVWDQATQRIGMAGLGGGVVGLLLGGGGRVMANIRARAEAGKLTPQQLEVMNKTKSEYDAIVAEGGIGSKQRVVEVIQKGQAKLAALEGEEAAAAFEAEVAAMDAELREIQRQAKKAAIRGLKPDISEEIITDRVARLPQQAQPRTEPESLKAAAKSENMTDAEISQVEKLKNYKIIDRGPDWQNAPYAYKGRFAIIYPSGAIAREANTAKAAIKKILKAVSIEQKQAKIKPELTPEQRINQDIRTIETEDGKKIDVRNEDIISVVSDELQKEFGWPQTSRISEATYFETDDGKKIRIAAHSVVYGEDVDFFIGIGNLPDADISIPENASVQEIKDIAQKAIKQATPSPAKPPAKAVTGETITDAAVKLPSGEIYTGTSHPQIATELEEKGIKFPQTEKSQGFVTSEGRFVLRKEAGEIARKAKQLKKEGEVFAHDFGPYGIAKPAPSPAEAPVETELEEYRRLKDEFKSYRWNLDSADGKRLVELEKKLVKENKLTVEETYKPKPPVEKKIEPELTKKEIAREKAVARRGIAYIKPVLDIHKTFMRVLEPSKAVERKLGKEAYAAVIKGIHTPEAKRLEFEQSQIPVDDWTFEQLEEALNKFSDKDLDNLMLSRGDPVSVNAQLIKRDAINKLPKELRGSGIQKAIQHIADFNYKYLQSVVGDDINRVSDYFYGIYKDSKKVDKFLDYWRTTKRFTKEKKLPTYADAKDYGLEIRNPNPINNLRSEYVAIARLEGMNWLKDELMRTGEGKFIDNFIDAPLEWNKVQDPIFSGLRLQPDLAKLINNLIATNKITQVPILNTLRQTNNFLRTVKFIGSAFHLLSVAKQSIADSGYLGFLYKPTATRGFTTGFRKSDPIFRTPQYRDYVKHGGGHRYSVESESRRAFNQAVNELNRNMGKAVKVGALPLQIPVKFVNWMFQSYIPKVKYAKYLDVVAAKEKKLGRPLKSSEKIDIIKEQQNFYGMMNERLFGRSGTVTTSLRFYFLAPGYAEGNYRTMIKAATQWGGKEGYRASRSRSNIVNSLILTGTLATIATAAFTGKWPKKPETPEDLRDLFKIDTGKTDDKGRRIMIDLMTYDKDYWQAAFNVLKGRPDEAVRKAIDRIGGMTNPTAEMIADLAKISFGEAIYDWKGDRVTEITDPFLRKVMKLTVHEVRKTVPISVSVYGQARRKEIDRVISATETLLGFRPTKTEKDKREQAITNKIYSLRGQQEKLYLYLSSIKNPRRAVEDYNKTVKDILDSPMTPKDMKSEWEPKLIIDIDKYLMNKVHELSLQSKTEKEVERAKKILEGFGVTPEQANEYFNKYYQQERKVAVGPLERHPVIGRTRKRKRLKERLED